MSNLKVEHYFSTPEKELYLNDQIKKNQSSCGLIRRIVETQGPHQQQDGHKQGERKKNNGKTYNYVHTVVNAVSRGSYCE